MKIIKTPFNYILSNQSKTLWFGYFVILCLFLLPYIIFQENAYIRIHDTLEGELGYINIVINSNLFYSVSNYAYFPELMDGLPRNVLTSPLTWSGQMYNLFGGFWGYVLISIIARSFGYFSFYYFLGKLFKKDSKMIWLRVYISFIYSCIPFFPTFGLYIMGVPALFLSFYYLYFNVHNPFVYVFLFFYTFFTNIIWSGIPLILLMVLVGIFHFITNKKLKKNLIFSLFIVILSNLVFNYNSIHFILSNHTGFVNHRLDYCIINSNFDLLESIGNTVYSLFLINYHVGTFFTLIILCGSFVFFLDSKKHRKVRTIFTLIIFILTVEFIYSLIEHTNVPIINELKSFRVNRMIVFLPFLWVLLFWLVLNKLIDVSFSKKFIYLLIVSQLFVTITLNDELLINMKKAIGINDFPGYADFFMYKTFSKIQDDFPKIKKDKIKIASIGMSPSISQFHEYSTADGYFSIFNLNYKRRFRKLISNELDHNHELKERFDCWGNRCYVWCREMKYEDLIGFYRSNKIKKIEHLDLDNNAIKDLKIGYFVSGYELVNPQTNHLKLLKKYSEINEKPLFLYKVIQ